MKSTIYTDSYSKNQTQIIKGFAILCIMLHNLFHWINPMKSSENEFAFCSDYVNLFLSNLTDHPLEFINIIFSYLGHYGVDIFIFISGYGLAKSFSKTPRHWGIFMKHRLMKIYPLLIIAFIYYFFTRISLYYTLPNKTELYSMLYKLLFIHTFIPNEGMSLDGPWWFFGLIIQLYIFFPILYKIIEKHGLTAFAAIAAISYATIYSSLYLFKMPDNIYIMQNSIGHFPEFCLGILIAKNKDIAGNIWGFILSLIAFSLGNFHLALYPLTFISITYVFVYLSILITNNKLKLNYVKNTLLIFGKYSMVLFAIHGLFRWQFVVLAEKYNHPLITLALALLFLIEVLILSIPAKKIYDLITQSHSI
ncbi:MAG: acyltransferase [Bacteroidales bacterium]|nr:acyltransferase [Bacteroidales bacterium]